MTVKFLKCSICGNIVGLIHDGGGETQRRKSMCP